MEIFKNTIKASDEALVNALLNDMLVYIRALLAKKDEVNIAISGGTTPQLLFENMAMNFANKFPWSQMHFY
jgi:6-phosphogluconolactonase